MRRFRVGLTAAAAVLLLGGCNDWLVPGQNPDRTAFNDGENTISPSNVGSFEQKWVWARNGNNKVVVSSHGVHVGVDGGCNSGLFTLDPATGTQRWSSQFACPAPIYSIEVGAPHVVGNRVLLGVAWTEYVNQYDFRYHPGILEVDADTGGNLAANEGSGALQTLREPARVLWGGYYVPPPMSPHPPLPTQVKTASVQRHDGTTFGLATSAYGTTLGTTLAYASGTGLLATQPGDTTSGPGVRAYSLDSAHPGCGTGGTSECAVWATATDGAPSPPVIGGGGSVVYVGTAAGTVYALDAATGVVLWTSPVGAGAGWRPPALANGKLYVPTVGALVVLDAATGSPLWSAPTGGNTNHLQPAVAGGVVFIASYIYPGAEVGVVQAFDAAGCGTATCPELWSVQTDDLIVSPPVVAGGQLYVATSAGVIAYGLPA